MAAKQFRLKRTKDEDQVRLLHAKLFPGDRFYEEYTALWLVVNSKGKAVGFCMFGEWSPGVGFLGRAGLLKKARGYGLHRRMIKARERFARKQGYTSVSTYTAIESVESAVNLERAGYSIYTPTDVTIEGNWVYWNKQLTKQERVSDDTSTQ